MAGRAEGKVAFITGAARGQGRICLKLDHPATSLTSRPMHIWQ